MHARWLALAAFLIPSTAEAQLATGADGYIIFKDGFSIHGKVIQQKQFEIDPASGTAYVIPSPTGFTFIDDDVRRVYFPPGQIAETVRLKPGELQKDQILLTRNPIGLKKPVLLPKWRFETLPPFDKWWEREVKVSTVTGLFPMHQRIVQLSPTRMRIRSKTHEWEMNFLTSEIQFDELTKLLVDYGETNPGFAKYTPEDKEFIRANFYQQMGRLDEAEALARELYDKSPDNRKKLDEFLELIANERAKKFAAEFEPLAAAKQHRTLIEKIKVYEADELASKVPAKIRLLVQELKNKYEADEAKLKKVAESFQFLMGRRPEPRGFWLDVSDTLTRDVNFDTLGRLDTFLTFADQHRREVEQERTPTQKVEEVLALAATGWHLGTIAAEPDPKLAQVLWKGRQMLPQLMKTDTAGRRSVLIDAWTQEANLPIDVVARFLQHLPPPNAYPKISDEVMTLDLEIPDAPPGQYLVQLPPDYNHHRPHPVLVLLHGRETPEVLLRRWTALAARHGFILAAPLWTKFCDGGYYQHSDRDHEYLLNCLRDLRRRFQVDGDRVFLFGWAQGAEIAWDFGLAHPDQFAGVLPMCGAPPIFARKYWQNAQNLGLYIVDGDKSGNGPTLTRGLFKEWIRCNYNAYYLEYKGRANELFIGEFEPMMEWMSRKKRQYPNRQLGSYSTSGAVSEEFRSLRHGDNHFYWLSSDAINDANTQTYTNWVNHRPPALFQGNVSLVNEGDSKGNPRIYNLISLRLIGMKQATVWLSPAMIDFTKPVQVRVNSAYLGPQRAVTPSINAMLEEHFHNADRQRLYYARIDLKLN